MSKKTVILVLTAAAVLILFGAARGQTYALATPTLTATVVGGSIMLSWSEVEGATRYGLWVRDCENAWARLGDGDWRSTEAVHSNPIEGRRYQYTVQALNDRGEESDWASRSERRYVWVEATVNPIPAPQFEIVPQGDHIQLVYEAVDGAVGYEAFVWYAGAGDDWLPLPEPDLETMTFVYTEVEPGVDYFFLMRSYSENRCGFSDWTAYERHTFAGGAAGGGEATATATATATPVPTATSNTGGPGGGTGGPSLPIPVNTATPTATPTPTATNTAPPADTATFTATPTATPIRPTLYANVRTADTVLLRWTYTGEVASYELQYKANGTWQPLTSPGAASSQYFHSDLTFGTTYSWRIRATDSQSNNTAWSNVVSRTVIDRPNPTATPTHTPTATRTPEPTVPPPTPPPTPTTSITIS